MLIQGPVAPRNRCPRGFLIPDLDSPPPNQSRDMFQPLKTFKKIFFDSLSLMTRMRKSSKSYNQHLVYIVISYKQDVLLQAIMIHHSLRHELLQKCFFVDFKKIVIFTFRSSLLYTCLKICEMDFVMVTSRCWGVVVIFRRSYEA